jgi:hypothetical protein
LTCTAVQGEGCWQVFQYVQAPGCEHDHATIPCNCGVPASCTASCGRLMLLLLLFLSCI